MTAPANITFLPWLRRGLATGLTEETGTGTRASLSATLRVTKREPGKDPSHVDVTKAMQLYGPGDVLGIDPRQVIRTHPPSFTNDFEPNYFPHIEFHEPTLPWLFTPGRSPTPAENDRLRPFIVLVVLLRERAELDASRQPVPVVTIRDAARELPNLDESWAWAHAQVAGDRSLDDALEHHPTLTLSRLLCPRKLEPKMAYLACVVPAFRAGVEAGLGETTITDTRAPAWTAAVSGSIDLPVYYFWEFSTGLAGDFEALTGRLRPRPLPSKVGRRALEMGGAEKELELADLPDHPLEGPLRPVVREPATDPLDPPEWTQDVKLRFGAKLKDMLRDVPSPAELAVPPPIYGDQHAGSPGKLPTKGKPWVSELNLDPRYRVAAALGVRVVQDQQEQLVASAWEQAGAVERANQALRQAELAQAAAERVFEKRLKPLRDQVRGQLLLLQLTDPLHARVHDGTRTVRNHVDASAFPQAAASAPFRRALRPTGPLNRRLESNADRPQGADSPVSDLLNELANDRVGRLLTRTPAGSVSLDAATSKAAEEDPEKYGTMTRYDEATETEIAETSGWRWVAEFRSDLIGESVLGARDAGAQATRTWDDTQPRPIDELEIQEPVFLMRQRLKLMRRRFHEASEPHQQHLGLRLMPSLNRGSPLPLSEVAGQLVGPDGTAKLLPARTIAERIGERVHLPRAGVQEAAGGEPLGPLAPVPRFPQPMYEPLRELSQEFVLPGLEHVPAETVSLLTGNRRFIEAYMVGLNHELSRELLWRGCPTDPKGTFFRQFWDVRSRMPDGSSAAGRAEDIKPIDGWEGALGQHAPEVPSAGSLVLLVRGELVRRNPNLTVYAAEAKTPTALNPTGRTKDPSFRAYLEPDLVLVGFDMTVAEARGSAASAGWFFVLQEHPTEPRFGLDVVPETNGEPQYGGRPQTWRHLSWGHLAPNAEAFEKLTHASALKPVAPDALEPPLTWGFNSAHMARITLQSPVRVAIHGENMLGPIVAPSPDKELVITCVDRGLTARLTGRIIRAGGTRSDGRRWTLSLGELIARIDAGGKFYAQAAGVGRVRVHVVRPRLRPPYVKTVADRFIPNNLLRLPRCPS